MIFQFINLSHKTVPSLLPPSAATSPRTRNSTQNATQNFQPALFSCRLQLLTQIFLSLYLSLYISAVCPFRLPRPYTGHVPVSPHKTQFSNSHSKPPLSVSSPSRVNILFPHSFPYPNTKIKIHFLLRPSYISFCPYYCT